LSWADGDASPKYVDVPLKFDGDTGPLLEYVRVVISDVETLLSVVDTQRDQAFITIIDQEGAGSLTIETLHGTFTESSGFAQLLVRRHGTGLGRVSVKYETMDGDAMQDVDFVQKRGSLSWEDGDTSDRVVTVDLVNDGTSQYGLHFKHMFVKLLNNSRNAFLDPRAMMTAVYILDDSAMTGFVTFAPSYISAEDKTVRDGPVVHRVVEGSDSQVDLTVTRLGGNQGNMSVRYRTLGLSAEEGVHFTGAYGLLRWSEGDTTERTISCPS